MGRYLSRFSHGFLPPIMVYKVSTTWESELDKSGLAGAILMDLLKAYTYLTGSFDC